MRAAQKSESDFGRAGAVAKKNSPLRKTSEASFVVVGALGISPIRLAKSGEL